MKLFIKRALLSLMLMTGLAIALVPVGATAQSKADVCEGIGLTTTGGGCDPPAGSPSVNDTVADVINILSFIVGVISVIMVIVGGFKYVLSSGDSNQINSAKNTILFALVGLAIVALAQFIVLFVLDKVTTVAPTP